MKNKLWVSTEISTEFEQNIRVPPTPEFDGILVEFKEERDKYKGETLYLDRETMKVLIEKMNEMMDYTGK